MKPAKHILFLVFISLYAASAVYAQWEKLIVNGDARVFNIFTINDNLFVFANPEGGSYPPTQLFLSTDDGNSFTNRKSKFT